MAFDEGKSPELAGKSLSEITLDGKIAHILDPHSERLR